MKSISSEIHRDSMSNFIGSSESFQTLSIGCSSHPSRDDLVQNLPWDSFEFGSRFSVQWR